jgi:hypothetical protein
MKKAGAFEVVDKKNAVVELYDAIKEQWQTSAGRP